MVCTRRGGVNGTLLYCPFTKSGHARRHSRPGKSENTTDRRSFLRKPGFVRDLRLADLFARSHRKQLVLLEAVTPVVQMPPKIEIDLRALRQPELCFPRLEIDRAVIHRLVLAQELNLRHGIQKIGLEVEDLEGVRGNPRASLQSHPILRIC